jgi:gamma-glutamyltranspeptidase
VIAARVLPNDINNAANDTHISIVDADGVALAVIQGLNAKLEETARDRDREIAGLRAEVAELKE